MWIRNGVKIKPMLCGLFECNVDGKEHPSPDFCRLRKWGEATFQKTGGDGAPTAWEASPLFLSSLEPGHMGAAGRDEGAQKGDLMGNLNFLLTRWTGGIPETSSQFQKSSGVAFFFFL